MPRSGRRDLASEITPKLRKQGTKTVPVVTADGTAVYRVRLWDPVLKRQIERTATGLEAAEKLLAEFNNAKRRPGRMRAEHARFADVATRYLFAQDRASILEAMNQAVSRLHAYESQEPRAD